MTTILTALAAALAVQGAAPPLLEDPEATLVEQVVVTARLPGPAWWRVSDADSTVYILALPEGPFPPGVSWDTSVLERRLKDAHTYIDLPRIAVDVRGAPALLRLRNQLRSKTPLEQTLPPDLKARFVAARQGLGKPASRYSDWTPLVAGQRLVSDTREEGWRRPEKEARDAAKRAKVRTVSPTTDGRSFLRAATTSITPEIQRQCFEAALNDVEQVGGPAASATARAWAEGRVAAAVTAPRSFDRCMLLLGGGSDIWRAANAAYVQEVSTALGKPGHAVAVVGLRRLLARDGVLQRLRARGLTVSGPAEPEV